MSLNKETNQNLIFIEIIQQQNHVFYNPHTYWHTCIDKMIAIFTTNFNMLINI